MKIREVLDKELGIKRMQVAIDNAKRTFDIDLNKEIARIKQDMDIEMNGLPSFWFILQRKNKFSKQVKLSLEEKKDKKRKERLKTNTLLQCPMNYLFSLKLDKTQSDTTSLSMDEFFVKFPLEGSRKKSKKVERLIEKYSTELYKYNSGAEDIGYELLENDFDELIQDISELYFPEHCAGLMSWLIDRTFFISPQLRNNKESCDSCLSKNRALLLKVLYKINPELLLKCFSKRKSGTLV